MAGPKAKYDPLEAAKVTEKTKADDDARLATGKSPEPAATSTSTTAAEPEPDAAPAAPGPAPALWEVTEPKLVSLGGGNMHRFKVGDRLDPAGYGGDAGLAKLGLKLKRVE